RQPCSSHGSASASPNSIATVLLIIPERHPAAASAPASELFVVPHHLRQHRINAVSLVDHLLRRPAERAEAGGVAEGFDRFVGNRFDVEQVGQQTVFSVTDHLADGGG